MNSVDTRVRSHSHHKGVVRGGDVEVHGTEGHVQCQANVHVGEFGLHAEKHCAPRTQGPALGLMEAVGLGGRVQAALLFH